MASGRGSSSSASPSRSRYPQFINSERQAPNVGNPAPVVNGNGNSTGSGTMNGLFHTPAPVAADSPPPVYDAPRTASRSRHSPPRRVLGAIDEDGGMAPDIPVRSSRRPMKFLAFFSTSAPKDEFEEVTGPNGEKFSDVRQNKPTPKAARARRRKWWIIVAVVIVLVVVALAVGLGVGLSRRNNGSSSSSSSNSTLSDPNAVTSFPAGSYSVTTFLAVVATGCTPNPSTWRCYPYQTYNQSQSGSQAVFQWTISGRRNNNGDTSFNVSTANNPFMATFSNAPLTLQNINTTDEYYQFSITLPKVVVPDAMLTSDGGAAQCLYNNTQTIARLYTKRPRTFSTNTIPSQTGLVREWPFAVDVVESSSSAGTIPYCQRVSNGVLGDRINIGTTSGGVCECEYMNYGN